LFFLSLLNFKTKRKSNNNSQDDAIHNDVRPSFTNIIPLRHTSPQLASSERVDISNESTMRYLVPASSCPPDDQPWLISSRAELAQDDVVFARWASKHAADPPSTSAAAQAAWVQEIEERNAEDYEDNVARLGALHMFERRS
jgi:hypothetical protein